MESNAACRPLRADARRNRHAILDAARAVFETDGILVPLDTIATAAGVGNATLYRNFPTRDDLLAAVMADSVRDALALADDLERDLAAGPALQEWLFQVAWQLRIWHDLPTCIAAAIDDTRSPMQSVCERLTDRTRPFLDRAAAEGAADGTVSAERVFELVTTLSWGIDRFGDDAERARQRAVLATAGLFRAG